MSETMGETATQNPTQTSGETDYEARKRQQIAQYGNNHLRFFPPKAHAIWMQEYMWAKVREVFGAHSVAQFYGGPLKDRTRVRVLSVGSGDGQVEVAIVRHLLDQGVRDVSMTVTELSPIRQARTRALVEREGLGERFRYEIVDFNEAFVEGTFDLVFAHHVLHHIVELELLYANIHAALADDGYFSSVDMIGRNGHQRWPEALKYTEMAWAFVPDHWKHNFQFNAFHERYLDHDCAVSGFEGVRAQDVLPLLLERFDFSGFVAGGGFHDVMIDRGYGQSIDVNKPGEAALVRFLSEMNEMLLETGRVKPTMMFAQMRKKGAMEGRAAAVHGNMTPEFAVRPTGD